MTITSTGYDGTVNEAVWAYMSALAGSTWCVYSDADWKVTIGGTGTLPVTVATGRAFGSGVMDVNGASINANAASISSGTRWDTVVIRRNWSTNTTTVAVVTGTATKQVTVTNTTPGTLEDQPIALIRVVGGLTPVQEVVDLRTWAGKIQTVSTAAAVPFLPAALEAWAFSQDTGHLWHVARVAGTPTWVDVDAPTWTPITLPSSVTGTPAYTKIRGIVYLRGTWSLTAGGNFISGTSYPLGTLPPGFRPGITMGFAVDEGFQSTANNVRLTVSNLGAISGFPQGDTGAIGTNGTSFVAEN